MHPFTRSERLTLAEYALPVSSRSMSDYLQSLSERLRAYCEFTGQTPGRRLGFGKDGTVWETTEATALKVYERSIAYRQEVRVYARLAEHGVTEISGHAVPQVLGADTVLGVLELTIVEPPFLLDFASARLDQPFDFPEDVMQDWWMQKRDEFGENWGKAVAVLRALEKFGVYMTDVHPGNIGFAKPDGGVSRASSSSS
jgi:hypothetical protein